MGELEFRKALFEALHADTRLPPFLGTPLRVFEGVPRGVQMPYVSLEAVSTRLLTGIREDGNRFNGSLGVYSRHADSSQVHELLHILSDVVERGVSAPETHEFAGATLLESTYRRLRDGRTWYGRVRFSVLMAEKQLV